MAEEDFNREERMKKELRDEIMKEIRESKLSNRTIKGVKAFAETGHKSFKVAQERLSESYNAGKKILFSLASPRVALASGIIGGFAAGYFAFGGRTTDVSQNQIQEVVAATRDSVEDRLDREYSDRMITGLSKKDEEISKLESELIGVYAKVTNRDSLLLVARTAGSSSGDERALRSQITTLNGTLRREYTNELKTYQGEIKKVGTERDSLGRLVEDITMPMLETLLSGSPDSALVVKSLLDGDSGVFSGAEAKEYDARAKNGEIWVFDLDKSRKP
ncbi:MAG: hypothetical protein KJ905_02055, partial [Nanoarchaeota archaeon]|nr:hypothetical protein [Nanoarchaeota archaeon]